MDSIQFVKDILIALKLELVRFRILAALLATLVLLLTIAVAINWPKDYESSALVVVDVTNVIEPLLRGAAELTDVDKNEDLDEIISSRRILERVYARLDPNYKDLDPKDFEYSMSLIRNNLSVEAAKGSKGANRIFYRDDTPDAAYETLTAIVDVFIAERAAEKKRDSNSAHDFISVQVENYKKRLELVDQKLKEFKSRSIDATEVGVKRRISELTTEIQNLELTINESEQKILTTQKQLREEQQYLSTRTRLNELESRRTVLTDQLDQLRLIYQDSYPDIVTIKKQVRGIDAQLAGLTVGSGWAGGDGSELPLFEELRKQLSTAKVDLTTQKRRLISLKQLLQAEYSRAEQVAENQAELADLTRDYDVTRTHYENMLSRKESSTLTLALNDEGQGASYRIVEPPYYPLEPTGLRALFIYLVAPILALGAPIGLAAVYVVLDPRLRSHSGLQQKILGTVDVIANVPHRGSPFVSRLVRKDMILLLFLAVLLGGVYVYGYIQYQDIL